MTDLARFGDRFHDHALRSSTSAPQRIAVASARGETLSYAEFWLLTEQLARYLQHLGLRPGARVGVYLAKEFMSCYAPYAVSLAGGVFVPINAALKRDQVTHILSDCEIEILITHSSRAPEIGPAGTSLKHVLLTDKATTGIEQVEVACWADLLDQDFGKEPLRRVAAAPDDLAALFYTSGSTGQAKGVMLTHRNLIVGIASVIDYLGLTAHDRLLAVLPFSFDYGFNQLTTALASGARCVLLDYLLPRDVLKTIALQRVTGLAGVPTLWSQLSELAWPANTAQSLKFFTNSGGAMPLEVLNKIRRLFPQAKPCLMYGLTEAFRSTYLPPDLIDERPGSMGKAIPGAELFVVKDDGALAQGGESGELVHCGALVAAGYWRRPQETAARFRTIEIPVGSDTEARLGVWSGDRVRLDEDGFLYFEGRRDGMIKTSGYRVSPEEIERVLYQYDGVVEAAAFGVDHAIFGQAVVCAVRCSPEQGASEKAILAFCRALMPAYMAPKRCLILASLPRNPNGKLDRKALAVTYRDILDD